MGRGLPLWLPNGTVVRDELEKLAKELEFKAGYQRVATPHLARENLYFKSGHLPFYADDMYPSMEVMDSVDAPETDGVADGDGAAVKEAYRLRPMNCPHHHKIFAAVPRSYRDLPLRLAEYGQVYRWEDSGAVGGLVRVRGMCMNDAHIYCTEEQVKDEFKAVMRLYQEAYEVLGLDDYVVRLSRWDPEDPKGRDKYVDNPAAWTASEAILEVVLKEMGVNYVDGIGEAAFYGPKIDIQFLTVTGREESLSTVQLDFSQPAALDLAYVGADGLPHRPYCIHRAPFSTHERMVAFLLEHYAGAFPLGLHRCRRRWSLSRSSLTATVRRSSPALRERMVRAELAPSTETVSKKIRQAATLKIPNVLIVGERERGERTVTLRRYGQKAQHSLALDAFQTALLETIHTRSRAFLLPE